MMVSKIPQSPVLMVLQWRFTILIINLLTKLRPQHIMERMVGMSLMYVPALIISFLDLLLIIFVQIKIKEAMIQKTVMQM